MPGVHEAKYSVHINMQKCKYVLLDIVIVNIPLRSGLHTHTQMCEYYEFHCTLPGAETGLSQ